MMEICEAMAVEVLLLYLEWTGVIQPGTRDPPSYTVVRSPKVTRSLNVLR
jgi:hypothetical protein